MLSYALAIFTGAFLLFQVQPLIGKYILPWFGGSPGVWTTCMLFFQVLLLGGYAYAHCSTRWLRPRQQAVLHLVLLVLSLLFLPITPSEAWKPHGGGGGDPLWQILALLTVSLGLPYFVLSSTGPLLQHWFNRAQPGVSPYRLYALSNVGSLLALISYPFYFESTFSRHTQAQLWSAGLCLFATLCGFCALRMLKLRPGAMNAAGPAEGSETAASPTPLQKLLWLVLPAIASALLLATTNKLCQDVAVIPFLWVLPLCLYLLTFILCFDHPRWYRRGVFSALLVVGFAVVYQLLETGHRSSLDLQIVGYAVTLLVACMVCHGELYHLRPAPAHLTRYYLFIAAGGALGGIFVAAIAPLVFDRYLELQIALWVLSYFLGVVCFTAKSRALVVGAGAGALFATLLIPAMGLGREATWSEWARDYVAALDDFYGKHWLVIAALAVGFALSIGKPRGFFQRPWRMRLVGFPMLLSVALGMLFLIQIGKPDDTVVSVSRNFYGTLTVHEYEHDDSGEKYYQLVNGAITHGLQIIDPDKAMWATSYYGPNSGVGLALTHLDATGGKRIGLVGLGTGSLAAYGKSGDALRIYEINPAVERLARTRFTYLEHCPAKVDVVLGDARLSMEGELQRHESPQFDLLALDAFSSDAIPVHLLTREAFEIYLQELKPGGVIAVHTSNRYLDLRPVVEQLARHFGLESATIFDDDESDWWIYSTTWILLTKNHAFLQQDDIRLATAPAEEIPAKLPLWTDDQTSLFRILKR
jgi:hypothetical protein